MSAPGVRCAPEGYLVAPLQEAARMISPRLIAAVALTAALSLAVAAPLHAMGAQKYVNPQFSELTKTHKKVAVLPFVVTIDLKHLPKNTTVEMVQQSARDEGLEFQRQLYSRLLQKSESEGYTVG